MHECLLTGGTSNHPNPEVNLVPSPESDLQGFCPSCGAQVLPGDVEKDECPSCKSSLKDMEPMSEEKGSHVE